MGDDVIEALFESLDAEPRPEFIATLRRRMEQEWADEPTGTSSAPRPGRLVPLELELRTGAPPVGRVRRRHLDVAIVVSAVAVILALLLLAVRTRGDVTPVDEPAPVTLPAVEVLGRRLRATIPVGSTADSIVVTADAVWASGWDDATVSRIDAETDEVTTVVLDSTGAHLAADEDGVWVGVDGGLLVRLDPDSGEVIATIETASRSAPSGSAPVPVTGDGSVWVHDLARGVVSRIDPQTNSVAATVDVAWTDDGVAEGIVVVDGQVWVNTCRGPVSIDPQSLAVSDPIPLAGCANSIGYTDRSLWVGLPGRRTARIDPIDREVEAILDVGPIDDAPFLATGDGAVWRPLTTRTIARIDTATNAVTEILDLGRSGQVAGFAVGHDSLWAGDYAGRSVLRIDQ